MYYKKIGILFNSMQVNHLLIKYWISKFDYVS